MNNVGLSTFLIMASALSTWGGPRSLLPQPREVQYDNGQLPLNDLRVCIEGSEAEEDRFSARELTEYLSSRTGVPIEIGACRPGETAIKLRRSGGIDALPVPDEKPGETSRESYLLRVNSNGVEIVGQSTAGVYYGIQTLKQLIEGWGEDASLTEVQIRDWPEDPYRGFMMDMSHTQLPTVAELKKQIDFLALWKINLYFFYSEASIELDGYPLLMERGRFSKAEVREVVEYARQRHIEVVPNLELYGHIHDLLRLERYSGMGVLPQGGEFNRSDPRIGKVVEDFVSQVAVLFPGPFFHIGFDETWLLEKEAAKLGKLPEELYLAQLREVLEMVRRHGKRPLAWADMLQKFPHAVADAPKDLIMVPWYYWPLESDEYEKLLGPFARNSIPMIVQGAVLNWKQLVPDNQTAFQNTDLLLAEGRKRGAIGLIMSGWTDDSVALTRLERPVIAHSAAAGGQQEPVNRKSFYKDYAAILYPPEIAGEVAHAWHSLDEPMSTLQNALGGNTINSLWANPFTADQLTLAEEHRSEFREARLAAEEAQEAILKALRAGYDGNTLRAMLTGARLVDYTAMRYLYVGDMIIFWQQLGVNSSQEEVFTLLYFEFGYKYHTRTADLMEAIVELKEQQRQAWLVEFSPFRLGVAMGKFDAEFQSWWRIQRRLEEVATSFADGDTLLPLDSLADCFRRMIVCRVLRPTKGSGGL